MSKIDDKLLVPLCLGIILCTPILLFCQWGIINDYQIIENVVNNSFIKYQLELLHVGRFSILCGVIATLLGKIWLNPYILYTYNFIIAVLGLVYTLKILGYFTKVKILHFIVPLLFLTPTFIDGFYSTLQIERHLFLIIPLLLWWFIQYKEGSSNKLILILSVSVIFILYKEINFILLGSFALSLLGFSLFRKQKLTPQYTKLLLSTLGLCLLFLASYFIISSLYKTSNYNDLLINDTSILGRLQASFTSIIYFVFSNPIITIGIPVVGLYRWKNSSALSKTYSSFRLILLDSMLISSFSIVVAYVLMGLNAHRYLLPSMNIGLFPLLIYGYHFIADSKKSYAVKGVIIIAFFNTALVGISHGLTLKQQPIEYWETIEKLINYGNKQTDKQVTLYLVGTDRGADVEIYGSISRYLTLNDLGTNHFDFKSMDTIKNKYGFNAYKSLLDQYSAYKREAIGIPDSGDLIIEIPFRDSNLDQKREEIEALRNLQLIYESNVAIPYTFNLSLFSVFQFLKGKHIQFISKNKPWRIYKVQ
ncbi:MAG: hypothetical protein JKY42_02030 [Flavobacteriales bacterium]|nr:hypothetical protein [Flavobacteriales bacterium]